MCDVTRAMLLPPPQTASWLPSLCLQEATAGRFNPRLLSCTRLNRMLNTPLPGAIAQNENDNNNQWMDSAYHEGIIGNAGASHWLPIGRHGRFVLTVD